MTGRKRPPKPLALNMQNRLARRLLRVDASAGDVVIREGDPGDPFGEIALFRDVARTATVSALEDTVLRPWSATTFLAAVTGQRRGSQPRR